jgi:cysteinyl-tRNA synthetase
VSAPANGQPLRLFNTLTRDVADFTPAEPGQVGMYSCGPTVYADQHIGNMRAYVFADTLKRTLTWKGLRVRHVINITDVGHLTSDADEGDDKLEVAARREQRTAWEIAERYTAEFKADLARLRVIEPDAWSKATEHITHMIRFATALDDRGWCYELPSGLYFDTAKDGSYGELARLDLAGLRAGARVDVVEGKRSVSDFAVWRTSAPGENRQMEWDSPWGRGAPGWHLECSVMSIEYLGQYFDIHTGGVDHIPVHHTNEIAQSKAYLGDGQPWVRWWLHGEFINLRGAKISKSTGGGVLVGDLIDRGYHPLTYRYLLLQAHYRSQAEFSWPATDSARTGLRRLLDRYTAARTGPPTEPGTAAPGTAELGAAELGAAELGATELGAAELGAAARAHLTAFDQAVSDDLGTPKALAVVAAAARDGEVTDAELTALAAEFDAVLGLGLSDLKPADLDLPSRPATISAEEIEALVTARTAARAAKDFARSDQLREELAALGVTVEDQPGGRSTWRWT